MTWWLNSIQYNCHKITKASKADIYTVYITHNEALKLKFWLAKCFPISIPVVLLSDYRILSLIKLSKNHFFHFMKTHRKIIQYHLNKTIHWGAVYSKYYNKSILSRKYCRWITWSVIIFTVRMLSWHIDHSVFWNTNWLGFRFSKS